MQRILTFAEAIDEATLQLMEQDANVFVIGLGVNEPSGVFGTTTKSSSKFPERFIDTPIAENTMSGVALGAAASGLRPIFTHQRIDFLLMAMDQIVNHLAKWEFIMAGKSKTPVTIRAIVGRGVGGGWGQACQHAQSLQALFAHIPGLRVVMPYSPYDAKGLLISCVRNNHPTIFIEHRSLHGGKSEVPEEMYEVPIGIAKKIKSGKDVTIIGLSAMNEEIKKAIIEIDKAGIEAEWIDLRSIRPWDKEKVFSSVEKTNRLVIVDTGHKSFGISAEIIASIAEERPGILKMVRRISLPDMPIPGGPTIEKEYYPEKEDIINTVFEVFGKKPIIEKRKSCNTEIEQEFKEVF